jgi:cell division protein ZapA (FtsZ GTPase activity inhibitor)
MSDAADVVSLVSILGRDYSIKTSVSEAPALQASAQLLKQMLVENSAKARGLATDRLLVLTALQLCQQQLAMQDKHAADIRALEAHVDARLADIASLMAQG